MVYSLPPSMIEPSYYLSVWGVFFATLIAVILEQALSNGAVLAALACVVECSV